MKETVSGFFSEHSVLISFNNDLKVVGEPVTLWISVFHCEQNISRRHKSSFWDCFNSNRQTAFVLLSHTVMSPLLKHY